MEVEVLNMASTIQVRVEDELKNKSDALFKDLVQTQQQQSECF